jgi:hypothetical protein
VELERLFVKNFKSRLLWKAAGWRKEQIKLMELFFDRHILGSCEEKKNRFLLLLKFESYTAPEWSDHVAVSAILEIQNRADATLQFDALTRACQPHKMQKSILDLFSRSNSNTAMVAAEAPEKKPKRTESNHAAAKFKEFFKM